MQGSAILNRLFEACMFQRGPVRRIPFMKVIWGIEFKDGAFSLPSSPARSVRDAIDLVSGQSAWGRK
jgi:hypothetical protein